MAAGSSVAGATCRLVTPASLKAAMRSRGFDGTFAGGAALRLRAADALFVAAMAALVAALRFGDAAGVLGALLTGVAR